MPHKLASSICPHCQATVVAYRTWGGRALVTTSSGGMLAVIGGVIGASIGLATGGSGIPAAIPLAAMGLVVGAGFGYIIADKALDKPRCPKCDGEINLGLCQAEGCQAKRTLIGRGSAARPEKGMNRTAPRPRSSCPEEGARGPGA